MKPDRKGAMAEPTYTLDEARTEIARQECRESGHSYDVIDARTFGDPLAGPTRVVCTTCDAYWEVPR